MAWWSAGAAGGATDEWRLGDFASKRLRERANALAGKRSSIPIGNGRALVPLGGVSPEVTKRIQEKRLQDTVWAALTGGGYPTEKNREKLEEVARALFGQPLIDERRQRAQALMDHSPGRDGSVPRALLGHATRTIVREIKDESEGNLT